MGFRIKQKKENKKNSPTFKTGDGCSYNCLVLVVLLQTKNHNKIDND